MSAFCLVLHTHLPYVRRNGVWPCGEDFFHQAAVESYLPLLGALRSLHEDGFREALTLSLSPMVAHQMADPHMQRELAWHLGAWELRAQRQAWNYDGVYRSEFRELAAYYARFGRAQAEMLDAIGGDLSSGFAALERDGLAELLTGPLTHPFLPSVREPSLAAAQVDLGVRALASLTGAPPSGMWLPECAYAPEHGIEDLLADAGIDHIVLDGPTLIKSGGGLDRPRRLGNSDVSAFPRNLDVTYRVWSPTGGYPSGAWYRDFFAYDLVAGFKDWRVTSRQAPIERKRPYEPGRASDAAATDAQDFAAHIASTLGAQGDGTVVVAAYDTELFGHWWFEGPAFLRALFPALREAGVTPMTLRAARERYGAGEPVEMVEGSWGFRKDARSWHAEETAWMWDALGEVEADTVRAATKFEGATGARAAALAQLQREAYLLQSSDWPFMVIRGRNAQYAHDRFGAHLQRWREMHELLRSHLPDDLVRRAVEAQFAIDNIAPGVDQG